MLSIDEMVAISEGYSGAEICSCVREAAMSALREDVMSTCVSRNHSLDIFARIKPATSLHSIKLYEDFAQESNV